MSKNQAHVFYEKHKEIIEQWLDLALYTPSDKYAKIEKTPNKINRENSREFRRYCLLRHQIKLLKAADLSRSKKVLDIGAGFGDYAITAKNFNFEQLDATDPSSYQYDFLSKKFKHYNNVFDLGIEEMDMSKYDTLVWTYATTPNIVDTIKNYILPLDNIKDILLVANFIHKDDIITVDASEVPPSPWQYDRPIDRKLYSIKLANIMFKSKGFRIKSSFARNSDPVRNMTSRYYLHYQRD